MHDFVRCGYAEYVTLKDRMERVNQGTWGRRKSIGTLHPFVDLNKLQLKQELNSRDIIILITTTKNKLLRHHLQGVQRVPSLYLLNSFNK